jgi:hypothetical protein
LNRSFRMPDYLQAVEGLELEQSVHLEADVDEPFLLAETCHILQFGRAGHRRVEEDSKWLGFDILCFRVSQDVAHEPHAVHCGCLLSHQTGRAGFPHPAFAETVALGCAGSCATVARRGQPSC